MKLNILIIIGFFLFNSCSQTLQKSYMITNDELEIKVQLVEYKNSKIFANMTVKNITDNEVLYSHNDLFFNHKNSYFKTKGVNYKSLWADSGYIPLLKDYTESFEIYFDYEDESFPFKMVNLDVCAITYRKK